MTETKKVRLTKACPVGLTSGGLRHAPDLEITTAAEATGPWTPNEGAQLNAEGEAAELARALLDCLPSGTIEALTRILAARPGWSGTATEEG